MTTLPPLPPQPANLPFIIFPAQWHWIGQAFQSIHDVLVVLEKNQEKIMTQQDQTITDVAANKAQTQRVADGLGQLSTKVSTELQQLKDAVAALPQSSPEVAAALADLETSTGTLSSVADQIGALGTQLDADDIAPAPTPAPPTP